MLDFRHAQGCSLSAQDVLYFESQDLVAYGGKNLKKEEIVLFRVRVCSKHVTVGLL